MAKILVVEDEKILRDAFTILLQANSYDVDSAENGKVALDMINKETYDLILLDLMMPILDGVGFLKQADIRTSCPDTKVIVLSNFSVNEAPAELKKLGVHRQEVKSNLSTREMVDMIKSELQTK